MFFEPMLRYLLIPAIFLLITILYPLFGRFYRHFATKSLNKKVSNVKDLKKVSFKERIKNILGYMKKHPIKSVIGLLFILLVIFVLAIGTKI